MEEQADSNAKSPKPIQRLWIIISVYVFEFVGFLAATRAMPGWYETVSRPRWAIPDWAFNPVQLILFAAPAFLMLQLFSEKKKSAVWTVYIHLAFAAATSACLFAAKTKPGVIACAVLAVAAAAVAFRLVRSSRLGALLVPTSAWVIYLAALSIKILH